MDFDDYQEQADATAVYPISARIVYPAGKLAGEAGELCNKIFKGFRDPHASNTSVEPKTLMLQFDHYCLKHKDKLIDELGDILWYVNALASDLDVRLADVAHRNIQKLRSRQDRDKIKGEGDER